jgi:tetratricopeptide (TPR) repeat protein
LRNIEVSEEDELDCRGRINTENLRMTANPMQTTSFDCNRGDALRVAGNLDAAAAEYLKALALKPDCIEILSKLATVMAKRGLTEPAIRTWRRVLSQEPGRREAWIGLIGTLERAGRLRETLAAYRQAISRCPNDASLQSGMLYLLLHDPESEPGRVFDAHVEWGRRFAGPSVAGLATRSVDRSPSRRLHLGYVSPDFRDHSNGRFLEPLVWARDAAGFQVFCYSDVVRPDHVTERFRRSADTWREIRGLSDEKVAEIIRQDRIDILIDSTGHMAGNRMNLYAHRPAPLQIALPIYPGTTGVSAIDYVITDDLVNPPGDSERLHVEKLIRLNPISRCYRPDDQSPETVVLPAAANGAVTFGSFNRLSKVTDAMLSLWQRIMASLPDSRLNILVDGPGGDQTAPEFPSRFERLGLNLQRVNFLGRQPRWQYLEMLSACDICLDTFPYNGCTTTCDSLWMGTPVVSLTGKSHVSRVGLSLLSQVGLTDLASDLPARYMEIAIALSNDRQRLLEIRSNLRERMRQSSLTDARRFTAQFEAALREIWTKACETKS